MDLRLEDSCLDSWRDTDLVTAKLICSENDSRAARPHPVNRKEAN